MRRFSLKRKRISECISMFLEKDLSLQGQARGHHIEIEVQSKSIEAVLQNSLTFGAIIK